MYSELRVGDVGTSIDVTIKELVSGVTTQVDVTIASTRTLIFQKPDGTQVEKTATAITSGSDIFLRYSTESGFLDQSGRWSVQAYLVIGGWSGHSTISQFTVYSNL